MSKDDGRSPSGRATHEQSPQAVSAVPVGIPSAGRKGRKLTRTQMWTLEAGLVWRDTPLTSVDLCGYSSCSPDSLWRLGFFDKFLRGQYEPARYQITAAGIALAQAMSARQGQDPKGLGAEPASAVGETDAPDPSSMENSRDD